MTSTNKSKTIKNPFASSSVVANIENDDSNKDESTPSPQISSESKFNFPPEPDQYIKNELAKTGLSEDSLKFGYNIGKNIIKESKFIDYFSLDGLKPYFDVDHKYILFKLKNIFIPFLKEKNVLNEENENSENKKYSIENPDLYIPVMSFVTYVLLIGFYSAIQNEKIFDPEILGKIASKNFFIIFLEVCAFKLLLFIFSKIQIPFFDCLCYIGYKIVLLVVSVLIWIILKNRIINYICIVLVCLWTILFFRKCLKKKIEKDNNKFIILVSSCFEITTILLMLLDLYFYAKNDKN